MWKPSQTGTTSPNPTAEPQRPTPPAPVAEAPSRAQVGTADQATIGKGLFVKGEITGTESLYIDGKVEGSINLPGNRVTIGRNGQVTANVTAREVIVLGTVKGNVSATDRVDIRAEGALCGDVACGAHQYRRRRVLQGWDRHSQARRQVRRGAERDGCECSSAAGRISSHIRFVKTGVIPGRFIKLRNRTSVSASAEALAPFGRENWIGDFELPRLAETQTAHGDFGQSRSGFFEDPLRDQDPDG